MSSGYMHAEGRLILDGAGKPVLLRGIGLGCWLVPEGYMFRFKGCYQSPRTIYELTCELLGPHQAQRFWVDFRECFFQEADVIAMVKSGFNSLRIPFNYKLLSPEDRPGESCADGYKLLDRAIEWCAKHGLGVILDMHCAPGGQTGTNIDDSWGYPWLWESPADQDRFVEIWRQIAQRYAGNQCVIGYDLLNEPIPNNHAQYNGLLEPLYRRAVQAIREVDPHHIVFLGGAHWDTDFSPFGAPFDDNLVYSLHKYWNETNQASIQHFLNFRDRWHVPLWNGETGENNNDWYKACIGLMEQCDIGWCFWPWKKIRATNCPYEIPTPEGWDSVIAFTEGGERPKPADAKRIFAQLLENIDIARCQYHADVVEALFAASK